MSMINLKDYYPHYTHDCYVDLPDEVIAVMQRYRCEDASHKRKWRRYKVYSLDRNDGLDNSIRFSYPSACAICLCKMAYDELYIAVSTLPEKQAQRIYQRYFDGMSIAEIARYEGVHPSSIRESICRGLRSLERILCDGQIDPLFWSEICPDR